MTVQDRVKVLCELIEVECEAARAALLIQCVRDTALRGSLTTLQSAADTTWTAATRVSGAGIDVPESPDCLANRARWMGILATPDAMGAYGAPSTPSTTDVVRPEPVPFDREAFRREAALRMLKTEKGRHGAAEDAARSVALADALITALEKPRGA